MDDNILIELKNISFSFDDYLIIENLSYKIDKGITSVIIGPSGCGKTLLLKIIAGIINPQKGEVLIHGKNILEYSEKDLISLRKSMGFLFQNYALFDSLTVYENVAFFLRRFSNITIKEAYKKVDHMLDLVRLPNTGHLKPSELSGGMKKRIGLARALIHEPEVLFLDEPSAGLDPISSDSISKLILRLQNEFNLSIIAVSNEIATAKKIAHKISMMYNKTIYKTGLLKEMTNSNDEIVSKFLKTAK